MLIFGFWKIFYRNLSSPSVYDNKDTIFSEIQIQNSNISWKIKISMLVFFEFCGVVTNNNCVCDI